MELTKEQIEKGRELLQYWIGGWNMGYWNRFLNAIAPHLQYPQPTALTDEEWKEIQSKAHSYHRSIWKNDIDEALSRRTAEPKPAAEPPSNVLYEDSTGGLHCDLAVADAAEPSTAPSEEIMPLADVKWDAPSPAPSGDAFDVLRDEIIKLRHEE